MEFNAFDTTNNSSKIRNNIILKILNAFLHNMQCSLLYKIYLRLYPHTNKADFHSTATYIG